MRQQTVRADLDERQVRSEQCALRVECLEIGGVAGAIAIGREAESVRERDTLFADPLLLLGASIDRRERILDLAKRGEHRAPVRESGLVAAGSCGIGLRAKAAPSKRGANILPPTEKMLIGSGKLVAARSPPLAVSRSEGMKAARAASSEWSVEASRCSAS
jgi:hypothetical protein